MSGWLSSTPTPVLIGYSELSVARRVNGVVTGYIPRQVYFYEWRSMTEAYAKALATAIKTSGALEFSITETVEARADRQNEAGAYRVSATFDVQGTFVPV